MAYNLGPVKPHVAAIANTLGPKYGIAVIYGYRATSEVPNSDHPKGLALDFMTSNPAVGTALAEDVRANWQAYGVTYVIWNRRIWSVSRASEGWRPYYGPSAHTDHVHVSFSPQPGAGGSVTTPVNLGFGDVADSWKFLSNPNNWARVSLFIGGLVLVAIALIRLTGSEAKVMKVVKRA